MSGFLVVLEGHQVNEGCQMLVNLPLYTKCVFSCAVTKLILIKSELNNKFEAKNNI